jgi:hypothetical protein
VNFISGLIPIPSLPWIESESVKKEPITDPITKDVKEEEISLAETKTLSNQVDYQKTDSLSAQQTTTDYSQFYVYKNKASDFIPFSKEEVGMDTIPDFGGKRKNERESGGQAKFRKYQMTEYLAVHGNEKKVKKQKRKRNKKKV